VKVWPRLTKNVSRIFKANKENSNEHIYNSSSAHQLALIMGAYISDHWRGQHSLMRSLGLNTITFNLCMVFVFSHLTNWIETSWSIPDGALLATLTVFWVVVLYWQAVGAFRAASIRIQNYGSATNYYCVFAVILSCAIFTLASVATQYGETIDYVQQGVDNYKPRQPSFELILTESNQLMLTGEIGYGATEKLNLLIKQNPQTSVLILNSDGGLIVESRGLANTINEHRLNTHVSQYCYSACALAFIAGNQRSIAKDAQLGFHQYYLGPTIATQWIKPKSEQEKDLRYFQEKNVAAWFMEKIYSTPHSSIWTPSRHTLHSAGVITTKSDTL